jgi:hypothetical protein
MDLDDWHLDCKRSDTWDRINVLSPFDDSCRA